MNLTSKNIKEKLSIATELMKQVEENYSYSIYPSRAMYIYRAISNCKEIVASFESLLEIEIDKWGDDLYYEYYNTSKLLREMLDAYPLN